MFSELGTWSSAISADINTNSLPPPDQLRAAREGFEEARASVASELAVYDPVDVVPAAAVERER
jgi:hypothetical protein